MKKYYTTVIKFNDTGEIHFLLKNFYWMLNQHHNLFNCEFSIYNRNKVSIFWKMTSDFIIGNFSIYLLCILIYSNCRECVLVLILKKRQAVLIIIIWMYLHTSTENLSSGDIKNEQSLWKLALNFCPRNTVEHMDSNAHFMTISTLEPYEQIVVTLKPQAWKYSQHLGAFGNTKIELV